MKTSSFCSTLMLAAALAASAHSAIAGGTATVTFDKDGASFRDFGRTATDRTRHATQLTQVFVSLAARHLADGQALQVQVLDVDLAGELKPQWRRGGDEIRVLGAGADWPSMHLRWTLRQGDDTVASGEERLSDMAYQFGLRPSSHETLPYEARMLGDWFSRQFGPAH